MQVLTHVLPAREDWRFQLNLWTNPWAVMRCSANVSPSASWADTVLQHLREHIAVLADAGQKCVTCTIVHAPWKSQTYDPHHSMVKWLKTESSEWEFDFSKMDIWIDLHTEFGVSGPIDLFSMLPWPSNAGCEVREADPYAYYYYSAADKKERKVELVVGSNEFEQLWTPFLHALAAHAADRGWYDRIRFAFDERNPRDLDEAFAFLNRVLPGVKMAAAGNWRNKTAEACQDFVGMMKSSGFMNSQSFASTLKERANKGMTSSFYTCANPKYRFPDTKLANSPSDAVWLGWHAAAAGFDGYLRWAYDSWSKAPLKDARFDGTGGCWLAGECFLSYPGGRSSIRLERLRDGIQDFEKMRVLRAINGETADLVDALLEQFKSKRHLEGRGLAKGMIAAARAELNRL